ncbi:NAD(P)/FAD-dependent oxidoreductase [Pseudomonas fluorescens]|uniref:NAD(P)/FAD-dependent oxidoreductase n=1 Tax=Pseudomonas fluorescens TaxID=294 RepID=UPI001785DB4D|nr:NAD(P)/FAD-dependent oxidoreductase [Pseudomonas fluorescens]
MSHRIVVVGGGAGGLELVTRLGRTLGKKGRAEVILVDSTLTHLWKPLLHEVAAGSLDASRNELNYLAQAKWSHFEFQLGTLHGIDRLSRTIHLAPVFDEQGAQLMPRRTISYDTLVLSIGSTTNDFNTPGVAEHCIFLDTPKQAERFRHQLLQRYLAAHARRAGNEEVSIAIVGAGATGVELAAELRHAADRLSDYGLNSIAPESMRITLIDAGSRVLPGLSEKVSASVHRELERMGVAVHTSMLIGEATADGLVTRSGEFIPADLKVWAAGIRAPELLGGMDGLETNRLNQLLVHQTLQTTRDENIFALGDCAACPLTEGSDKFVPPRAQAAHQQAELLAKSLALRIQGYPLLNYQYRDLGSLVSLSRFSAVGQLMGNLLGSINVSGWLARMFYVSLYRMHQASLYGPIRTLFLILAGRISRRASPRLKLH